MTSDTVRGLTNRQIVALRALHRTIERGELPLPATGSWRGFTRAQRAALDDLQRAWETDAVLLDADEKGHSATSLRSLEKRRLARQEGDRLWRLTLGGVLFIRHGVEPASTGLTNADRILAYLVERPGSTAKDIQSDLSMASTHAYLLRLRHNRCVTRRKQPEDGAYRYYAITGAPKNA